MTGGSRVTMNRSVAAVIGIVLVLTGAGASYVLMRVRSGPSARMDADSSGAATVAAPPAGQASSATTVPANGSLRDVVVTLDANAIERAGIVVAPVVSGSAPVAIRLPGTVEPNAYRQVAVTPLVAGRITRVSAELGASVRRGQPLAHIYSPGLAEAQTKYASARAMLDAHDRELQRTAKLVEIGAASRQEMERVHAEHAAQTAAVESARSQLELLGVSRSAIDAVGSGGNLNATAIVPAPIDGVVTERVANVGLNVDETTLLFTVVDLSTVWIIAQVYESDFSRVRVGDAAIVTTPAFPGRSLDGHISFIDPQVNSETKTARVRVEVSNPRGELRLGMNADVVVTGSSGASMPTIPRSAVQNVGDRTVIYLANPKEPGRFTEREVRLGEVSGEQVQVASGVLAGDIVVTQGSFFVRAELERLGLRRAAEPGAGAPVPVPRASGANATPDVQSATIVVNEQGFDPATITLRAGSPARVTFMRITGNTCATEVAFPSLNVTRTLPLNTPVQVEFTPSKSGDIAFACGMNMLRGTVIVK